MPGESDVPPGAWCAAREWGLCACGFDVAPGDPVIVWGSDLVCGECTEEVPEVRPIVDVPTGDLL